MKRILSVLLTLGLFGAVMVPAASAATCSAQYTVRPGDNLFRIGLSFGVPWPQIAAANNLPNPGLIFPGQVLCIPGGAGTPAPAATASESPTVTPTGPTPTPSDTALPTDTAEPTHTPVPTYTPMDTAVPADTATPTDTAAPGDTATPTDTAAPGDTATPTDTAAPGDTATPTDTAMPGDTPTATATGQPTATSTVAATPSPVIPTFSISSVVKNTSVTIQTANFPPNQDFVVSMGPLNNMGLGGVVVTTINSGAGGTLTATFNLPASLVGTAQISIRMQSAAGYYAFNWFWNATAP